MRIEKPTQYKSGRGNVRWLLQEHVDAGYFVVKGPDSTSLLRAAGEHDSTTIKTWCTARVAPKQIRAFCTYTMIAALMEKKNES